MHTRKPSSFGELLRDFRRQAGLTQEALAERAGLSVRAISDLERGVKQAPYRNTVARLAAALDLAPAERTALVEAVASRRLGPAPGPAAFAPRPLPSEPTRLVGRERDEAAVVRLLQESPGRLLTIVGPGGVGKTRLALRVAATLAGSFRDGVMLVSLAEVARVVDVPGAMARAAGLLDVAAGEALDALIAVLRGRQTLLVLDNVEHVLGTALDIARMLDACPRIHVLVTGRESLHLRREQIYDLAPLRLPDGNNSSPSEAVLRYPALQLFLERARAFRPDFSLAPDDIGVLAHICRRLDGIPLAIELAAARVRHESLSQLDLTLSTRLIDLGGGARDLPRRQQTMLATLEWSYSLLAPEQRHVLRAAAHCVGSFDGDSAAEIAVLSEVRTADLLRALADKSLLRSHSHRDRPARYSMLEVVREFALAQSVDAGEFEEQHMRHARYFARLCERAETALKGQHQADWMRRVEDEHDNIVAALRRLERAGAFEEGLRMASALWTYWTNSVRLREGSGWIEALLTGADKAGYNLPGEVRARALAAMGRLNQLQGNNERARVLYAEGLACYEGSDDLLGRAILLNNLGAIHHYAGEYDRAREYFAANLEVRRRLGDAYGTGIALNNIALGYKQLGEFTRAESLLDEALAVLQWAGEKQAQAGVLNSLAEVSERRREWARAVELYQASLTLKEDVGDVLGTVYSRAGLAVCYAELDRRVEARGLLLTCLRLCVEKHAAELLPSVCEAFARVDVAANRIEEAVALLGQAGRLRDELGEPVPAQDAAILDALHASARMLLGENHYRRILAQGARAAPEALLTAAESV